MLVHKYSSVKLRTLSIKHSVPANMAPTKAKFFPYDIVRTFISLRTSLTVGVSVPVMFGSIPAVNKPNAAPITAPETKHVRGINE